MAEPNDGQKNFITRTWKILWRPSARYSIAVLMIAGFGAGIIFWGGYNWGMELSNTETFCVSCHEMRAQGIVAYYVISRFIPIFEAASGDGEKGGNA